MGPWTFNPLSYLLGGGAVIGFILAGVQTIRLADATGERDRVQASIDAPLTGWAARLTTSQNNVMVCVAGVETQTNATKELADKTTQIADQLKRNEDQAKLERARTTTLVQAIRTAQPLENESVCTAGFRVLTGRGS